MKLIARLLPFIVLALRVAALLNQGVSPYADVLELALGVPEGAVQFLRAWCQGWLRRRQQCHGEREGGQAGECST